MSLTNLSEIIGMTHGNLSLIERGIRSIRLGDLQRCAEILETDIFSLMTRGPDEPMNILPLWAEADQDERKQIVELAKVILHKQAS